MSNPKIIVLGAGYAGLKTVKQLQNKNLDAEIILVNKNDHHYETTQLHELAAGTQPSSRITFPILSVIDSRKVTFIQDVVTLIKKDEKKVVLEKQGEISYDYLVIALGFESETFGVPGVKEFSKSLVDIVTAEACFATMYENLSNYAKSKDETDLSIAVCGAGFTSIEYLGEITNHVPKLADKLNFPKEKVKITCIESRPTLLPMFSEELRSYGVKVLEKRGVEFKVGTPIKELKENAVVYEENGVLKEVKASTIIWATGVRGSSIIAKSGFTESRGRVIVEPDLTVAGYPEVFMVGDVSSVIDPETGNPFPTTAQIALKQGEAVAENLAAKLANQPTTPFTFKSAGTIASIGNNDGIGNVMGKEVKGYIGSIMKKTVVNKVLLELGNTKILMTKGRFDYYH